MIAWNSSPVPDVAGSQSGIDLFDTARKKVVRLPAEPASSLYVCGITPYDATHLGHASTYVAFDLLNRTWRDAGSAVSYVQNVTDVDDPLLERATATGRDWRDLAEQQIELFRTDMAALNVLAPDHYIGAVESIHWIVPVVESMVHRGLAYAVEGDGTEPDGDIYFSLDAAAALSTTDPDQSSAPDPGHWSLGQLSHLSEEHMLSLSVERGGDPDRPGKRNRLDPLLWRRARKSEPEWDGGQLGSGRPGWHIECAVIAQRFLPSPFTVQGGGSDLVFPHHEMSAGHAWASSGRPLASYYAHTGMVGYDGGKMSKSRGNLVLVSTLRRDGVDPAAIRLAILSFHYRADWSWTDAVLQHAVARLERWRSAVAAATPADVLEVVMDIRSAMASDLDAPAALAAVDAWAARAGQRTDDSSRTEPETTPAAPDHLSAALDALLGVKL